MLPEDVRQKVTDDQQVENLDKTSIELEIFVFEGLRSMVFFVSATVRVEHRIKQGKLSSSTMV